MSGLEHFIGPNEGLRELALFAGAGGGILGGHLLGWRTVCAVEWEPYPAAVLAQRQNDGILPPFPIWDDVRTFDGRPWRGIVDVVSGGFPCQDISAAGRGAGLDGERSGLWREMARVIGEVRPRYAFVENSPVLTSRGLGTVLGDLAALGYNCRWGVISALDAGGDIERERLWIVASSDGFECETRVGVWEAHDGAVQAKNLGSLRRDWVDAVAFAKRSPDDVAARVDRLKAIGNGQVPAVARLAWETLTRGT